MGWGGDSERFHLVAMLWRVVYGGVFDAGPEHRREGGREQRKEEEEEGIA